MILQKIFKNDDDISLKIFIPLLPLRDIVVFPNMVVPLFVGRSKSVQALASAMSKDKSVFLATQKKSGVENPKERDINLIGTIGNVLQLLRLPDGSVKALIEGKYRAKIIQFVSNEEFFKVEAQPIEIDNNPNTKDLALHRAIIEAFEEYAKINTNITKDFITNINSISNSDRMTDTLSAHFAFKMPDKQKLLETLSLTDRLNLLLKLIKKEIEIFSIEQNIKTRVKDQMDKTQKNYYLNEQIKAIKKEMGAEDEGFTDELKELEKNIKRKRLPKEAADKVRQELKKLKMMAPLSAEATVVRNYIDWIIDLPWYDKNQPSNDIENAEKILDEDHYGLEKPKERILEYIAVQTLINKVRGPILCFVGPPGVGKTSLAKSVAKATGRKFVRLSLGGVRDEAEIRGHRRTYIGAMPGKIIQSLKRVHTSNPVFCLDEVDKMSMDFRGDPSSALLEVLDPEQNFSFNDHYMDLDYDLSDILFITTANTLPDIPLPLQDRMEVIRLPGYTEYEKQNIAKNFLIPKQIKANGLENKNISFEDDAVFSIIREHTREAGVRNLEREISTICRKIAHEVVKNKSIVESYKIDTNSILKYLGPAKFKYNQIEEKNQIGLVTGLAWTQVGGELLGIETSIMPGRGEYIVTGKLGDVMKESARAAISYVRTRTERLKIDSKFYKKYDIHIHIPEGATPKDGPSAGISMCTSIISALTKRPVYRNVAMTGEITLRGRVLPIGGLKEKVLAAHRGNIRKVIIPKDNENDLKDIPAEIANQIEIVLVESMDEVLNHALIIEEGETIFNEIKEELPIGIMVKDIMKPETVLRTSLN